ncbi:MAG TPA: hypothetical protein P5248_11710, partial [Bacteroidales bacterium]|nr:hypothetical protein [Bacteroidales bacterium]
RGLGHGCDEEALRLVRLLRYGKAKNRGLRVKASMSTRIHFKLPPRPAITYEVKRSTPQPAAGEQKTPAATEGHTITWTLNIPAPGNKN